MQRAKRDEFLAKKAAIEAELRGNKAAARLANARLALLNTAIPDSQADVDNSRHGLRGTQRRLGMTNRSYGWAEGDNSGGANSDGIQRSHDAQAASGINSSDADVSDDASSDDNAKDAVWISSTPPPEATLAAQDEPADPAVVHVDGVGLGGGGVVGEAAANHGVEVEDGLGVVSDGGGGASEGSDYQPSLGDNIESEDIEYYGGFHWCVNHPNKKVYNRDSSLPPSDPPEDFWGPS